MITFPMTLPADGGPSKVTFRDVNVASVTAAPFSLSEQIQEFDGQAWELDLTFPPMDRVRGAVWVSALRALRGPVGSFFFLDPAWKARGFLGNPNRGITVQVDGGGQQGVYLNIKTGQVIAQTGAFKAGDVFSLGSGTAIHLHSVLEDVNINSAGKAQLTIWPRLRVSPANSAVLNCTSPRGLFRLVNKGVEYDRDEAGNYLLAVTPIREAF